MQVITGIHNRVETGSGQSTYPSQMCHFFLGHVGQLVKLKESGFTILFNIAVIKTTVLESNIQLSCSVKNLIQVTSYNPTSQRGIRANVVLTWIHNA